MPSLEIGLEGSNKAVFWGRTFGLNQYSAEPSIVFNTGQGFYLYNTNYYWSDDVEPNLIAKSDLGMGYERYLTENLSASLSYEKWIYYNGDDYVKHAIQNSLELQASYELPWLNLVSSGYYMFGNIDIFEGDFSINQEYHICSFTPRHRVYFTPQLTSIFANKNFLPIYSEIPSNFDNNNRFRLINLELTFPLRIQLKDFEIEPTFHYNMPIQQPNENVHAFNYFSLKLIYNLYFDKH